MAGPVLPAIPPPLKGIQHYLKIASEHDKRDPVVSYWCRLYAFETGMKLSTKTSEETNFLIKLMDWLEMTKRAMHDNEAITNNVAAQAHLENWALKLFLFADKNDRAANFGKNVVQSFYTAGLLYDVITTFGDLTEEALQNRKYAKWKAAYIHNCLKNGETPVPGPMKEETEDDEDRTGSVDNLATIKADTNAVEKNIESDLHSDESNENQDTGIPAPPTNTDAHGFPSVPTTYRTDISSLTPLNIVPEENKTISIDPKPYNPAPTPSSADGQQPSLDNFTKLKIEGGVTLSVEQMAKAQKLIKWAGSALNYDDVPTTVTNLQKALHLLTTGQELP